MKRQLFVVMAVVSCCLAWLAPLRTVGAAGEAESQTGAGHGLDPLVLVGFACILVAAKLGGELFERIGQPVVLGELIGGIVIGNLALFGFTAVEPLKTNEVIAAVAELGVILLLFEVGLESDLKEMMEVGWSSLLVAVLGVIAPFFLGWAVSAYFIPGEPRLVHLFIGATLCATSVGITARVFKDLGKLATREARVILGAAVIDDVLGLLILAIVAGAIKATAAGGALSTTGVVIIAGKSAAFLIGSIVVGQFLVPRLLATAGRLRSGGVLLTLAISFCLLLSWAAAKVGLAPIVGAFAAGLVLDEVHYQPARAHERDLRDLAATGESGAGADIFCGDGNESRPAVLWPAGAAGIRADADAGSDHWETGLFAGSARTGHESPGGWTGNDPARRSGVDLCGHRRHVSASEFDWRERTGG